MREPVQDVHRGAADQRRLRPRRGRHPVPAGSQGHRAGQRPGRGTAQQRRPAAGRSAATAPASSTPAEPLPHFNEVDEGVAVDALVTNRIWTAMGLDPATTLHDIRWGDDYDGRVRLGLRDLRLGAGLAQRRLRKTLRDAAAADVLPARRRHADRRLEDRARSSGPGSSSWTARCTSTSVAGTCRRAAAGGDPAPPGRDHPAVADHARRAARRQPRSADGPAQGQPRPGRLRPGRRRRRPSGDRQGGALRRARRRRAPVRRRHLWWAPDGSASRGYPAQDPLDQRGELSTAKGGGGGHRGHRGGRRPRASRLEGLPIIEIPAGALVTLAGIEGGR